MTAPASQPLSRCTARTVGVVVLLFLITPLLVLIPLSFTNSSFFVLPENGWSLRWYYAVFADPQWHTAARNSVMIATGSSIIAVVVGTPASIGLVYLRGRIAAIAYAVMLIPLVAPVVIVALAVFLAYNRYGLTETLAGIVIAHAALGIPFVIITVVAALKKYDVRLYFAAVSLGANRCRAFFFAVLPSIGPAMLAGAVYAFQASFDESIVVLFLSHPEQVTLPRLIFAGMTDNITPAIAVVAVLTTLASILLMLALLAAGRIHKSNPPPR